jgi:hypothetical protein
MIQPSSGRNAAAGSLVTISTAGRSIRSTRGIEAARLAACFQVHKGAFFGFILSGSIAEAADTSFRIEDLDVERWLFALSAAVTISASATTCSRSSLGMSIGSRRVQDPCSLFSARSREKE